MGSANSEKFFELVKWFNGFGAQLDAVYTKISKAIEKDYGYKEKRRYCNYLQNIPWITQIFYLGMTKPDETSVAIISVLDRDKFTNQTYKPVLSLIVARIDGYGGFFDESLWSMFAEDNASVRRVDENLIAGEIEDTERRFCALQFDMEVFNKKNIGETIKSLVMPEVRKLFLYKMK